jgi:hypothetical protein
VHDRQRYEHARAEPVDQARGDRRAERAAQSERAGGGARHSERPALVPQEEDQRQAVDADRHAGDDHRGIEARHARSPYERAERGHGPKLSTPVRPSAEWISTRR